MITTLWTTVNTDAVLINYAVARIRNKQTVWTRCSSLVIDTSIWGSQYNFVNAMRYVKFNLLCYSLCGKSPPWECAACVLYGHRCWWLSDSTSNLLMVAIRGSRHSSSLTIIKTDAQQAKQAPDFKPIRPTADARKANTNTTAAQQQRCQRDIQKWKIRKWSHAAHGWMDGWASNEAPNQWVQSVWLGDSHTAQVGCIINRTNQDWLRYSMCWWKEMSAVVHPLKTQETTKQRHGSRTIGAPRREKQQQTCPQISCLSSRWHITT